jgi:hypothetical protein
MGVHALLAEQGPRGGNWSLCTHVLGTICYPCLRPYTVPKWLPGLNETANYVLPIPLETTPHPTIRIRKRDRDRAERIRLAGGPKPTSRERAVRLALEKGEVRTKDLTDIGVPRCYLARICEEGLLAKVGYGRYRAAVHQAA